MKIIINLYFQTTIYIIIKILNIYKLLIHHGPLIVVIHIRIFLQTKVVKLKLLFQLIFFMWDSLANSYKFNLYIKMI
jgi:hypothetical protein